MKRTSKETLHRLISSELDRLSAQRSRDGDSYGSIADRERQLREANRELEQVSADG